ncbi:HAD-superfamily hydrolase, subfamily IIB [Acidovorax delafieldii 2AN]|uniref:HAD-superfamily hydrolase, subfamily IIB n=1 Tax=Acidovorax delafieldii 2AN TaxID=573060 RepID=C5T5V5_ACIDE|nr:HAD-IIB family hydrolase [Acidovorax delafieldii]EER60153.1 HAD-superfamily hydrolase, subfamily IIB [Acidovorax delafieldii 2AN]
MQPLTQWPALARVSLQGILTDIDDTLTTEGAITPDALGALADLKAAGLHVIPITGRPVGWSEPFAITWPVDSIVAENGAVALRRATGDFVQEGMVSLQSARQQPVKTYQQDAITRAANYASMQQVLAQIEREVPGARRATDSPGRETDIAIDHSEFTHLPQDAIDHAVRIMRAAGMNATVSSIHINGWFGAHNKLEGARWIVRELLGRDLDAEIDQWVYVGDSTNDQLMFQHFPHSVGVANIARFVPQLTHLPRYVTQGERGAGFAEVARAVLATR